MTWLIGLIICSVYLLIEKLYFAVRPRPTLGAGATVDPSGGTTGAPSALARQLDDILPWAHAYAKGLLPILALILLIQSLLVEPSLVAADSMLPTMESRDFMLVNKFTYGIRVPFVAKKLADVRAPQRGEIMAFHSPLAFEKGKVYVKRIVGVPGDRIRYSERRLLINGDSPTIRQIEDFFYAPTGRSYPQFAESLNGHDYRVILFPPDLLALIPLTRFPHPNHGVCVYDGPNVECTVPPGMYFVMGDNRDLSLDSRAWGFVTDDLIVGRSFFLGSTDGSFNRWGFI